MAPRKLRPARALEAINGSQALLEESNFGATNAFGRNYAATFDRIAVRRDIGIHMEDVGQEQSHAILDAGDATLKSIKELQTRLQLPSITQSGAKCRDMIAEQLRDLLAYSENGELERQRKRNDQLHAKIRKLEDDQEKAIAQINDLEWELNVKTERVRFLESSMRRQSGQLARQTSVRRQRSNKVRHMMEQRRNEWWRVFEERSARDADELADMATIAELKQTMSIYELHMDSQKSQIKSLREPVVPASKEPSLPKLHDDYFQMWREARKERDKIQSDTDGIIHEKDTQISQLRVAMDGIRSVANRLQVFLRVIVNYHFQYELWREAIVDFQPEKLALLLFDPTMARNYCKDSFRGVYGVADVMVEVVDVDSNGWKTEDLIRDIYRSFRCHAMPFLERLHDDVGLMKKLAFAIVETLRKKGISVIRSQKRHYAERFERVTRSLQLQGQQERRDWLEKLESKQSAIEGLTQNIKDTEGRAADIAKVEQEHESDIVKMEEKLDRLIVTLTDTLTQWEEPGPFSHI